MHNQLYTWLGVKCKQCMTVYNQTTIWILYQGGIIVYRIYRLLPQDVATYNAYQ